MACCWFGGGRFGGRGFYLRQTIFSLERCIMDKMAIEAQKPRVLVFTTAYAPFIGGAEVAVEQIAKRLKDKFEFFIITSRMRKDLPRREVRDEGTVIRIGFGTRFDKFWLLIFSRFIVLREFKLRKGKTIFWVMDFSFGASAAGLD